MGPTSNHRGSNFYMWRRYVNIYREERHILTICSCTWISDPIVRFYHLAWVLKQQTQQQLNATSNLTSDVKYCVDHQCNSCHWYNCFTVHLANVLTSMYRESSRTKIFWSVWSSESTGTRKWKQKCEFLAKKGNRGVLIQMRKKCWIETCGSNNHRSCAKNNIELKKKNDEKNAERFNKPT